MARNTDMYYTMNTVLNFITNNLADAVAEVESRNSITIEDYKVLQLHTPLGHQYPSIHINPISVDEVQDLGGNGSFYGNPSKRDKVLAIRVWDRGNKTSTDKVETNVIGYMDALEELFKSDYTLSNIKGIDILDTTYTDLFPDLASQNPNFLLKGATLQIRVRYNKL